ncbi:hypothetical protein CNMCM6936_005060 [Aspergillus lentulus]|nr:hypothetical protein CNMCM6069_005579 [Aspergillus lentulus]KAF4167444.1 hypothetical protein CNMCM6936_005060 [Aspergillus lentulus]
MPATDTEVAEVEKMFKVNVFGPMRMVHYMHRFVIEAKGVIVNIGSIGGVCPYVYGASYNASKAALHHYGNTLRVEMRPFGVRVVNVISGEVHTNILKNDHGRSLPDNSVYYPMNDAFQAHLYRKPGSGIGRDCALAFASEGARGVAFADINLTAALEAAEESKAQATNSAYRAIAVQVDVSSEASVQHMVDTTLKEFNRIDYGVNSAGLGIKQARPVSETCMAEFDNLMSVNVKGTMLCVRALSRAMKNQEERLVAGRTGPCSVGRGSIVNLASANSVVAFPEIVQYTAAKHAVLGITKTAALDNAPHGIRVNAVCPSWVETPMIDKAFAGNPEIRLALSASIPAGRLARPEEVSNVVLFLSGPKSSYVTGVGWLVDGGTTLQMKHG